MGLSAVPAQAEVKSGSPGIAGANYAVPVTKYGHDALGPGHEWSMLVLQFADGRSRVIEIADAMVFEDTEPRLADLDGDGTNEVIAVESSLTLGSRLAVYRATGFVTATPFIGQRHRWLAPFGAADLDGDGHLEIAYVETPHVAPILKIVRLDGGRLTLLARKPGLTNHRFGDDFIQGGIATCAGRPTILTADAGWTRIMATVLTGGKLASRDLAAYDGPRSFDAVPGCD